ncbi:hypothetical protein [Rubinisphaera italica]|uniref:Uncharacterized protein n=1 Tax=Rubinisphaera italica TaxID=2527969 RepID=A0A5C5XLI0_9PLAN|nr:hypothetical protein [Rubinisphaera italica]TWT64047.1 hypothetical protein Pan54_48080 [Rubinisphaera italica]
MQNFKKRARLFAEKLGGEISFGHDGSLTFAIDDKSATFDPVSKEDMNCSVKVGGDSTRYQIPKSYIFDIIDKLGTRHLASSLLKYELKPILQLNDYIVDEKVSGFWIDCAAKLPTTHR